MEDNKQIDTLDKSAADKSYENKSNKDILASMNVLALAFMGDAVYESAVRKHILILNPFLKVNELHKRAVSYVKASAQAAAVIDMLHEDFLTEQEISVVKRARNHASNTPKNADVSDYRYATGLEALIGYSHLIGQEQRTSKIISRAIEVINQGLQLNNK